jgi:hypothetical protein
VSKAKPSLQIQVLPVRPASLFKSFLTLVAEVGRINGVYTQAPSSLAQFHFVVKAKVAPVARRPWKRRISRRNDLRREVDRCDGAKGIACHDDLGANQRRVDC